MCSKYQTDSVSSLSSQMMTEKMTTMSVSRTHPVVNAGKLCNSAIFTYLFFLVRNCGENKALKGSKRLMFAPGCAIHPLRRNRRPVRHPATPLNPRVRCPNFFTRHHFPGILACVISLRQTRRRNSADFKAELIPILALPVGRARPGSEHEATASIKASNLFSPNTFLRR